jgi:hypothetical protein
MNVQLIESLVQVILALPKESYLKNFLKHIYHKLIFNLKRRADNSFNPLLRQEELFHQ